MNTGTRGRTRPRVRTVVTAVVAAVIAAVVVAVLIPLTRSTPAVLSTRRPAAVSAAADSGASVFRGLGAWADVSDYDPGRAQAGTGPQITPGTLQVIASYGVHTLFIQTYAPGGSGNGALADPGLLEQFLAQAHHNGMQVVGWYRLTFTDPAADLSRLEAIARFDRGGQRFDGIGVDIEVAPGMPDSVTRTARLIEVSRQIRRAVGKSFPMAAIVVPPLILTRIAPSEWPGFPWKQLAPIYNVWIPMSYWTFRQAGSQYADARQYTQSNIELTRRLLGRPDAAVYALGGVGDQMKQNQYQQFLAGASAAGAIGVGVYDYRTTSPAGMALLAQSVPADGYAPAASHDLSESAASSTGK